MKIQRFTGKTNHEVMRQVRQVLGPDAMIVSSQRTDDGVEILAADAASFDDDGRLVSPPPAVAEALSPSISLPNAPQSPDVMAAISELRGMLETRMDGMAWEGNLRRTPVSASLFRSLLAAGFSTPLLRAMLARLPESLDLPQATAWARNELISHLPLMRHEDDLLGEGGVFALVGPTGVGKTTTIAKLAARCVLRVGADRVAMLTTDSYRIGALEQLQIYGRLMRVPVHGARDLAELRQVLQELGERDIVLIDNVGISQRDRYVAEQAAMLCAAGRKVRRLLVLNAASHGDTLDEVAHAYRGDANGELEGCIITKLDEAPRLGAALDTAIRHRLPIHYVSQGQKVPEHLSLARAAMLVDRALAVCSDDKSLYAPNDADIKALWSANQRVQQTSAQELVRRRRHLLLTTLTGGQADSIELQHIDDAAQWLRNDALCCAAHDTAAGDLGVQAAQTRSVSMVRESFASQCQSQLLVMHGKVSLARHRVRGLPSRVASDGVDPLSTSGMPTAQLAVAMLLSDQGKAMTAVCPQLLLPQGTVVGWDETVGAPVSASEALLQRVTRLAADYPDLPTVHLLESGTPGQWQQLSDMGAQWLSRVTAATRVVLEDGPTTTQALARTLMHAPVRADFSGITASPDSSGPLTAWAAETVVQPSTRGHAALRLVSVRLIDSLSGEVRSRLYGFSNLPIAQVNTSQLAAWLVRQDSARHAFKLAAHAWGAIPMQDGVAGLRRHAVAASQLGLATWQVSTSASASAVRSLLTELLRGTSRRSAFAQSAMPGALLRLFALLQIDSPA